MDQLKLGAEDADGLVDSLNLLLDNLDIPLVLESPCDLTPSLLLAILESTLKSRLPLSDQLRQAHSPQSKVEAVKVFLGVLGSDVLKIDLSTVDPRRLARGEWEEVVYMGILLVRVAKGVGMLEADGFNNIIDLDPDATSSRFTSEATSKLSVPPPVSRTPSPPPARAHTSKPLPSTAQVTGFTLSPLLPSAGETSNGRERRNPRPPENESTPPSSTRKASYMTYRPLASPPKATQTTPIDISICSCAFGEDLTASTVHCHCEIHGSDGGRSDPDTSVDDSYLNWRNKGNVPINILDISSQGKGTRLHSRFQAHY